MAVRPVPAIDVIEGHSFEEFNGCKIAGNTIIGRAEGETAVRGRAARPMNGIARKQGAMARIVNAEMAPGVARKVPDVQVCARTNTQCLASAQPQIHRNRGAGEGEGRKIQADAVVAPKVVVALVEEALGAFDQGAVELMGSEHNAGVGGTECGIASLMVEVRVQSDRDVQLLGSKSKALEIGEDYRLWSAVDARIEQHDAFANKQILEQISSFETGRDLMHTRKDLHGRSANAEGRSGSGRGFEAATEHGVRHAARQRDRRGEREGCHGQAQEK